MNPAILITHHQNQTRAAGVLLLQRSRLQFRGRDVTLTLTGQEMTAAQGDVAPDGVQSESALTLPNISIKAILQLGEEGDEGRLVEGVSVAWWALIRQLVDDPRGFHEIPARTLEEIIAGAYRAAGFDEVTLTPRSGDKGRDVIAIRKGFGCIKIIDQAKAYAPGHVVTADEVRAMIGTFELERNASKAVLTTTSTFAPRLREICPRIAELEPYRLELKDGPALTTWLEHLRRQATA